MAVNRIVPHLPWLVLMALATYLYKERIFAESGFYAAQFVNNQTFWIEFQRFVSGIPQLIPLMGVWTGLGMKYILILYSLSHVLFFYTLFLFVYYGLRDRRSGLLIILSQTVGIMYGFFTPIFELYYAVPLLITFYAIWQLPFRFRTIYILLILEALILLSHPLAFILFAYLLLFDYTKKTAKAFKFYIPVILVFIGALVLKYLTMSGSEAGQLAWLYTFNSDLFSGQFFNPEYAKIPVSYLLINYSEILIAFLLVVFMLVKSKQWFRLLLAAVTFFAYLFTVSHADPLMPLISREQVLYPFVAIVFIPLVFGFPKDGRPGLLNISILMVSALIVFRLAVIYYGSEVFVKRVAQIEQLIETARQKAGNKFVVSQDIIDHGYTQLNWSYPVETMLLSAIDGNDITVTIASENDLSSVEKRNKIQPDQFLFANHELKEQSWLNKQYFHMDIGPYHSLNDSTPNKNLILTANNLRITINSKKIYRAMDTVWIPVTIINRGKTPVFSGMKNKVFLSYFWIVNNDVLNWSEIRTPLQSDIYGQMRQDIKVAVPRNKGRMQLKADIIADDNWLGIFNQEDVLVY